ncbi:unnamed protein product [Linum tenue]|uniref:S-protein homolog n=1 Tax=Linum tenue TaxID=586396 RepID=A0AAV0IEC3_9ROSI|nr:unnamed protein product [Linum tenue]
MARPSAQDQRTVYVQNELSGKKVIVRCQSKDDSIGSHVVDVGSDLRWGFGGTDSTVFWCNVAVEDRRLSFEAFRGTDDYICCRDITWVVRDDGVHLLTSGGEDFRPYRRRWNHL